eukprot:11733-Eustigmatos_ZCMA.PRE.1
MSSATREISTHEKGSMIFSCATRNSTVNTLNVSHSMWLLEHAAAHEGCDACEEQIVTRWSCWSTPSLCSLSPAATRRESPS